MKNNYFTYSRNNTYRNNFFSAVKGIFGGRFYFCSYCGKLMPKNKTTVDHLFPVASVRRQSSIYRSLLKMFHITDINDIRNLVPACEHCNKSKGSKTGIWIIKGIIGHYQTPWLVMWCVLIVLAIILSIFVIKNISI